MGGHGNALAFGLGQRGIGGDDGDGGIGAGRHGGHLAALKGEAQPGGGVGPQPAKLSFDLKRGGVEMAVAGGGDGAHRIGPHQRTDHAAIGQLQTGRAEPAFDHRAERAGARADRAYFKLFAGRFHGLAAQIGIGVLRPILVSAVE